MDKIKLKKIKYIEFIIATMIILIDIIAFAKTNIYFTATLFSISTLIILIYSLLNKFTIIIVFNIIITFLCVFAIISMLYLFAKFKDIDSINIFAEKNLATSIGENQINDLIHFAAIPICLAIFIIIIFLVIAIFLKDSQKNKFLQFEWKEFWAIPISLLISIGLAGIAFVPTIPYANIHVWLLVFIAMTTIIAKVFMIFGISFLKPKINI